MIPYKQNPSGNSVYALHILYIFIYMYIPTYVHIIFVLSKTSDLFLLIYCTQSFIVPYYSPNNNNKCQSFMHIVDKINKVK